MNFIPASMVMRQKNQKLLSNGGKLILLCSAALLALYFGLLTINTQLEQQNTELTEKKNRISALISERSAEQKSLQQTQLVAAGLDNLNSFNALMAVLETLNQTIPDETELENFETSFNNSGESQTVMVGIADSHKNLMGWIDALRTSQGVAAAELLNSESIQSSASNQLRQRFEVLVTREAHKDSAS